MEIVLELKPILQARAKKQQVKAGKLKQKSAEPSIETRKELARKKRSKRAYAKPFTHAKKCNHGLLMATFFGGSQGNTSVYHPPEYFHVRCLPRKKWGGMC